MKILVIGGSSGIGYSAAARLSQEGHQVISLSRRGTGPENCANHCFDISVPKPLEFPLPEIVIISAGMGAFYRPDEVSKHLSEMARVNLLGPIQLMADLTVRARREHKHIRIITITSTAGDGPAHGLGVYAAMKKGIEGYVRAEGPHQAKRGVTLIAASMGWFESPMTENLKPEIKRAAEQHCPGGRFATAAEAANFIVSLALGDTPTGVVKFHAG